MKINKKKLKSTNFMLLSGIKTEQEVKMAIDACVLKIKIGQQGKDRTLNECWGLEDLEKLLLCIDFKEDSNDNSRHNY